MGRGRGALRHLSPPEGCGLRPPAPLVQRASEGPAGPAGQRLLSPPASLPGPCVARLATASARAATL